MAAGKLSVTAFVTLDGVVQGPGGRSEDATFGFANGGWVTPFFDEQLGKFISDIYLRSAGFVLGRGTYTSFAGHWPTVTDTADPVAVALNTLPKFVASTTLQETSWTNSTIVRSVSDEIADLKSGEYAGKELQCHGSPGLVQTLLKADLVDEINAIVFPIIVGGPSKRLFGEAVPATAFKLISCEHTATGVLLARYERVGPPSFADAHE
eukprot:c49814_g1_i1.p1 GENE.c49814_g1_i1~~c49814_g1_i1.p1  ORF type:complete len:223 (+),score=36.62 c49814_g1_i1:44-670(+)